MADQCIVCLENLDVRSSPPAQLQTFPEDELLRSSSSEPSTSVVASASVPRSPKSPLNITLDGAGAGAVAHANHGVVGDDTTIAVIQVCGHVLHDACLREWTGKANSCPICRQTFHLVHVYDKIGGTQLSSYKVEDKKQVAEFDPQAWLDDNPEIEETRPCPICDRADREDILLLCDSCDAAYHTHCIGLDHVPRGHWFCLECADTGAEMLAAELQEDFDTGLAGYSDGNSNYLPRTQASMRRARQQARSNDWQGAWGQIAGRVWDALDLDLDNHDDTDEALQVFRRSQQRRERERRDYQRWQQRLNIASRVGARDVFVNNISNVLPSPVVRRHQQAAPPPSPPLPQQSPEEKQAWGALDRAIEADKPNHSTPSHRKRKSRSVTASPVEPQQQPERKLKRPRTRRVPTISEGSSSNVRSAQAEQSTSNGSGSGSPSASTSAAPSNGDVPSFLSTLLKEVEMSAPSDDENVRTLFTFPKPTMDASSPASSPSSSVHGSPRALSSTPPPHAINERPGSPLSLSSHIEPIYPPANFLANRANSDQSDSDSKSRRPTRHHHANRANGSLEIQHPRPRRQQSANVNRHASPSKDTSPARVVIPFEMKESISGIVKDALKPHWKSGHLTADQYASINRDLSHKLYKEVSDESLNEDARQRFERIANKEVARAVADLKA